MALSIRNLVVNYGPIRAVRGIDLDIADSGITALVGANGAGKTTTLLALSGLVKPASGSIRYNDTELAGLSPHRIVAHGIVQVPEGRSILMTMSVKENLDLGAHTRRDREAIEKDFERVMDLFPSLRRLATTLAGNLSGGEQQMLAIARALMAAPKLLLLDEPSMGLAPLLVQEIFKALQKINRGGIAMLLVEQNVRQALRIARQAYVLENGSIALAGTGEELLDNPRVVVAYLGG